MDMGQLYSLLVLVFLVILTVLALHLLIGKPLRPILDELIKIPACTDFYCRLFVVVLTFAGLGTVLGGRIRPGKEPFVFMDYVWAVANKWSDLIDRLILVGLLYIIIITILLAVLRRKSD